MKLSVTPGDPGYRPDAKLCIVTLDGKRVQPHDLIMADDSSGILVTYKRHANGVLAIENSNYVTLIRRGAVTIALPESSPADEVAEVPFQ